jgi:hypothetical protein
VLLQLGDAVHAFVRGGEAAFQNARYLLLLLVINMQALGELLEKKPVMNFRISSKVLVNQDS